MIQLIKQFLLKIQLLYIIRVIRDNISRDKEIEKKRIKHYKYFLKPGDLVFDIGANLGNRSIIFSKLSARVISFEPQDYCFNYLKWKFFLDSKVTVLKRAVSSNNVDMQMFISEQHVLSSLSKTWLDKVKSSERFLNSNWSETEIVKTNTLDFYIKHYGQPAFIKIDVEGFEYEVIKTLQKPITLSYEFNFPEGFENCIKCLNHLNVISNSNGKYNYSIGENVSLEYPKWVSFNEMKFFLTNISDGSKINFGDIYFKNA